MANSSIFTRVNVINAKSREKVVIFWWSIGLNPLSFRYNVKCKIKFSKDSLFLAFKPVEQIVAGRSAQISPTCCSVNAVPPHPNRITPGNQHQVGSDITQQHQQQQQIHHPVCHRVFSPSSGGPGGVGGVSGGMQHQQPMGGQGAGSMGGYNQQQDYTTPPFPHTTHFTGTIFYKKSLTIICIF